MNLAKGSLKKIRDLDFETGHFGISICDICKEDFSFGKRENFSETLVAKKFKYFKGFGNGDAEQLECYCIPCLEKKTGKKLLKPNKNEYKN